MSRPQPPSEPWGPWGIVAVEPSSTNGVGFWDGHDDKGKRFGGVATDLPLYPISPVGGVLRVLRSSLGLNLREGAEILGISVIDMSGLERGSRTLSDPKRWREIASRLSDGKVRDVRRVEGIERRIKRLTWRVATTDNPKRKAVMEERLQRLESRIGPEASEIVPSNEDEQS